MDSCYRLLAGGGRRYIISIAICKFTVSPAPYSKSVSMTGTHLWGMQWWWQVSVLQSTFDGLHPNVVVSRKRSRGINEASLDCDVWMVVDDGGEYVSFFILLVAAEECVWTKKPETKINLQVIAICSYLLFAYQKSGIVWMEAFLWKFQSSVVEKKENGNKPSLCAKVFHKRIEICGYCATLIT